MDKKELVELVMSYKKSSAFMVAYEMGILEMLHGKMADIRTLSQQADVNENHFYLFLLYLKSLNLVDEQNGKWSLASDLESSYIQLKALDDVIHHEKNIYQRWMYPERLEQSLKAKNGERDFDQIGFSEMENKLYEKTMYGTNLKILSLRIMRELRKIKNPVILEYGRSKGYVLQALKKTGYLFDGYYMPETSFFEKYEKSHIQNENGRKFDVIILYNTIHYYDEKTWNSKLKLFKDMLSNSGCILIVDLFYQEEDIFSSEILLDWITHGGTDFVTKERVEKELEKNDLRLIRSIKVQNINSTILIICKRLSECNLI